MPGKQGDNKQGDRTNGERPTEQDVERLSVYLDGALDATERAALERRLAQDATLQRALGELRQTKALLRALPTPALPRSFALPEVGEIGQTAKAGEADETDETETTGALRTAPRVRVYRRDSGPNRLIPRPTRTARVAQWMGTLVAVLGLALLLGATLPAHAPSSGSALPFTSHSSGGASTFGPNSPVTGSSTHSPVSNQHASTPTTTQASSTTPTTPTSTPTTTSGASTGGSGTPNTPAQTLSQNWLPALGVLLLIGGVVLFAFGRFARPRR